MNPGDGDEYVAALLGVLRRIDTLPEQRAHDLVACVTCHARVDEACRTSTGRRRRPHDLRVAPHLCPCGRRRGGPGRQLCDGCRDRLNRESKRDYMRRVRAA